MIDDGTKSALSSLNYNIGASGRKEYKGKQKRDEGKLISFSENVMRYV